MAGGYLGVSDIVSAPMRTLAFATQGAITGAATAAISGGDIGQGILGGAIVGGAMGFMSSEQFQNWRTGDGFNTNQQVASANYAKLAASGGGEVAQMRIVSTGGHSSVEIYDTQKNTFDLYGKRPAVGETNESIGNMKYILGKATKGDASLENIGYGRSTLKGLNTISLNRGQLNAFNAYRASTTNATFALKANCVDWAVGAARSVGQYIPKPSYSTLGFSDPAKLPH